VVNRYTLTQPQRHRGTEAIFPASTHPHNSAKSLSDQQKISLLLFILGQGNLNSTYPHETARSLFFYRSIGETSFNLAQNIDKWERFQTASSLIFALFISTGL